MPHQIIEYSANLGAQIDIDALVRTLHAAAAAQSVLPLAGLRTRAYGTEHYAIADEHPDNGFIAVYLRIGQGRDAATRVAVGEALFAALCDATRELVERAPVALSYELQEIDTASRWNRNNLRDYLTRRENAG